MTLPNWLLISFVYLATLAESRPDANKLLDVKKIRVNVSDILSERLGEEKRSSILQSYENLPHGFKNVSILNLTSLTLENLNMQYENIMRELAPAAVRTPHLPLQTGDFFLSNIPSEKVWTTVKDLPSGEEPWNTLPGKFVILKNVVRGSYRPIALWDSGLMTYYSMYLDGLSESQLQIFEYELPLRRLNEMANDLSALHTKYGKEASCHSLVRNLNENLRRLSDLVLSEKSAQVLLSCASYLDMLLQHNDLYSLTRETDFSSTSAARAVLQKLIDYLVSTSKPIPLNLVPALDSNTLQQLASKYQFKPSFMHAVIKKSDHTILELSEHYATKYDSSNSVLRFLMSPYSHFSQLKEFQLNIRLLCSQIGNINSSLLSAGQKLALFGYYKSYCHASNGVINQDAISRSKLSLCLFDSSELIQLSVEDLKEMRELIASDCSCMNDLQKFVIFQKIENDLIEHEFFRAILPCFESFVSNEFAGKIIRKQVNILSFCHVKLADSLLQSKKISDQYLRSFDFILCDDSKKLSLVRSFKYSDEGALIPLNSAYRLDYLHFASLQVTSREGHQRLAKEFIPQMDDKKSISQLEAYALAGPTLVELPVGFVASSKFCSEAIFAIGFTAHKLVPSSVLTSWVDAYFACQPDKLVLATRKDLDILGNLVCFVSPNWVKMMTHYTFNVYLSRISQCVITLQLGGVIRERILERKTSDNGFTFATIAPLYCFLDPSLNQTQNLLSKSFYSVAANAVYNMEQMRALEFSESEMSALIGCADALAVEANNEDPSLNSLATLTCTSRTDSQFFSCWNYLKFQYCK